MILQLLVAMAPHIQELVEAGFDKQLAVMEVSGNELRVVAVVRNMILLVEVVNYKLEEVRVMGVACNKLGEVVMVRVVVESTLHTVVVVGVVLYMAEVKVEVESELEEVGSKHEVAVVVAISKDRLEVVENAVAAVENEVVEVVMNNVVVEASYSSKELVVEGKTTEVVEVVNMVVEVVATSHNM